MSNLEEKINKEYPLHDIQNSISKTDEYNGNEIQFIKRDAFKNGYELCKKEYEEKLRWIPVEKKLPPIDIPVILKFKDWKGNEMYQIYTLCSVERRDHFLKTHLKFTEWRSFL